MSAEDCNWKLGVGWSELLTEELDQPYMVQLREILKREYEEKVVYPAQEHLFEALRVTPFQQVKAVILGQDPYHGPGQAHGLSFSVQKGVPIPPSLVNIYKELSADLGGSQPSHGCLQSWAEQGVLLLNTVLTVRQGMAGSHQGIGWERFTDRIIHLLNDREQPIVFILWGKDAQAKQKQVDSNRHLVITGPHPSPLSAYRGFWGSKPFSKTNEFLFSQGIEAIDWKIADE